jgi:hypothetical protein
VEASTPGTRRDIKGYRMLVVMDGMSGDLGGLGAFPQRASR